MPDEVFSRPQINKYRPDIDGLRAVAVLFVIGFHVAPNTFRGGFVGVDIFFVISGYLISGILFREVSSADFSYRKFYGRRIRRIFPALAVVLIASLIFGYVILSPIDLSHMAVDIASAAGFVANLQFWREASYFDGASNLKPALHLWSLGVEEQYYIIWPLIVALLMTRVRHFLTILTTVLISSFIISFVLTYRDPTGAYFLPFSRFWELMLGSILAYIELFPHRGVVTDFMAKQSFHLPINSASVGIVRNGISCLGVCLFVFALFRITNDTAFPGWWALAPTLGAFFMIAAGPSAVINRRLLSTRVAIFFGVISYPLYLWHWPALAFLRNFDRNPALSSWFRIVIAIISVILAWLTYRFVEKPVRYGKHLNIKTISLMIVMTAIGVSSLAIVWRGTPSLTPRDEYLAFFDNRWPDFHYAHTHDLFRYGRDECNFLDVRTYSARAAIPEKCTDRGEAASTVLLWGDSHAQHLLPGLMANLPSSIAILQITTSACSPTLHEGEGSQVLACERSNRYARETIKRVRPDVVVLAQRSEHLSTDWSRMASEIRSLGARSVILVGPTPKWTRNLPSILADEYWPELPEWISDNMIEEARESDKTLKLDYGSSEEMKYVSIFDILCGPKGCRSFVGPDKHEDIESIDDSHLTTRASIYVVEHALKPILIPMLATTATHREN